MLKVFSEHGWFMRVCHYLKFDNCLIFEMREKKKNAKTNQTNEINYYLRLIEEITQKQIIPFNYFFLSLN